MQQLRGDPDHLGLKNRMQNVTDLADGRGFSGSYPQAEATPEFSSGETWRSKITTNAD
jgi:hypothetical protein